jgi:hypothetical protein
MASTGTHPAAAMLFRIVDAPAGRYAQPQVRRIGLNISNPITQLTVTMARLAYSYSPTVLMV